MRDTQQMQPESRIYVAGHRGLVGSALVRTLQSHGFNHLILRAHSELDLCDQRAVAAFFADQKPEYVFLAAAKVGGIHANNTYPADFIRDNLLIQTNIMESARLNACRKLLFLGSSCIYPKLCPQPIKEEYLLTGPLEPTNEAYALAKIAGIMMCRAFRRQYGFDAIAAMPTNLYGPGDNFHPENSHVLPSLIRRFHEAKLAGAPEVAVWGTGTPRREFLYADDLADALLFLMQRYSGIEHVNVGCGADITILEVAQKVASVVGYAGSIATDPARPDGTPRKLLDVSALSALGWHPKTTLDQGIRETYRWFVSQLENSREAGEGAPI